MAKRSFTRYVEQELGKFPHFLVYAILEWVLIILLFIDGFLAFVANEYARFFELRVPCLLCTRIDHVLVHRNPDFYYNDSVCEAHKKEVSSLAYCHNHKKMSDIRNMCEACLLSFATEKESDCNTYKALVGILHKDLECFVEDDSHIHLSLPAGRKDDFVQVEKSSIYCCSCCGEPLKVKSSYSKGKGASAYSLAPASSPRTPFLALRNEESRNADLAHIRYTELKFISENSSPSEDEDGLNALNPDTPFREDVKAATVPLLTGAEDLNDDASKTPNFGRGNRFFGIPLTDSATNSPRWGFGRITRKSPLEKTVSASESIEDNLTNEADSDSILHHLKRQVRLDRKSLMALYMELDEERSASAIAANNAMAMITRLQAEKAAVQMEALQYQRMMEEQAEYDEEALQATNDLLAKREEDFKVLEAEVEAYRGKYGCLREDGFTQREMEAGEDYCEYKAQSSSPQSAKSENGGSRASVNEVEINRETAHNNYQANEANGGGTLSESLKGFKGEESPILGRFKKLDKKNQLVLDNGVHSSPSSFDSVDQHINDELEKPRKPVLTRELSHLSKRVKALEADNGFLDHAAQTLTLEKHSEGTTLLLEISRNLRKLRHLVTSPIEENDAGLSS